MKATLTRKTDLEILIESRDKNAINALIEQKRLLTMQNGMQVSGLTKWQIMK